MSPRIGIRFWLLNKRVGKIVAELIDDVDGLFNWRVEVGSSITSSIVESKYAE